MNVPTVAKSRRLRSTIYSSRIEKQGLKSYTVYNHMLLPAGFSESLDSKMKNGKIPFFHLGPENNWKNKLDKNFQKKINEVFKKNLDQLHYF